MMCLKSVASALVLLVSAEALATVDLVLPQEGEVVSLLNDRQKKYLSMPTDVRVKGFDDPVARARRSTIGSVPDPVVLVWSGVEWDVTPAEVEVRRDSDGKVVFRRDVSLRTQNVCPVYNLETGAKYSWRVRVAGEESPWGHFETAAGPRLLSVEGVPNFRDLGGYVGYGGRRVRQGLIYRSSCANRTATTNAFPGAVRITERSEGSY